MQRDAERLNHIVDSVAGLPSYVQSVNLDKFTSDKLLQDAVLYRLTVLGADFRNVVVHEYHRIDWFIVWDVITKHLPQMQGRLNEVYDELDAEDQD